MAIPALRSSVAANPAAPASGGSAAAGLRSRGALAATVGATHCGDGNDDGGNGVDQSYLRYIGGGEPLSRL
uniref:Uncharacterized protein n=1 Tax=Oryza glumipatula TaxID=40148 RepID=A0A0D9YSV3_9ORYZ